jgi:hypothetical protein
VTNPNPDLLLNHFTLARARSPPEVTVVGVGVEVDIIDSIYFI